MVVTKAELVDLVEDLEEIIINKLVYLKVVTLVEILVVAVELTQVAELILNQELVKVLVDLEMVKDQDKELDKV